MRASFRLAVLALVPACSGPSDPGGGGLSGGSLASMTTSTGDTTTSVSMGTTTTAASSSVTDAGTSSGDDSSAAGTTDATTSGSGDLPEMGGSVPEGCKAKKIDVLFVTSGDESMEPHYGKLVKSFPSLLAVFENQLAEFDPHILVVNNSGAWGAGQICPIGQETCPEDGGCAEIGEPNYPCWALYTPGAITKCDKTEGAGVIFPAGVDASNKPCDLVDERRYIHAGEPDPLEAFMCLASHGHSVGPGIGQGWATARAVSDDLVGPGGCNEGFLRDDALLLVIMVTRGTDWSGPYNPYVWASMVLDAKGGEQDAVIALGIFADNDLPIPDPICDWGWNDDGLKQLREMLLNFEHVLFGSLCESSTAYGNYYADTAEVILDLCGGPIPK